MIDVANKMGVFCCLMYPAKSLGSGHFNHFIWNVIDKSFFRRVQLVDEIFCLIGLSLSLVLPVGNQPLDLRVLMSGFWEFFYELRFLLLNIFEVSRLIEIHRVSELVFVQFKVRFMHFLNHFLSFHCIG